MDFRFDIGITHIFVSLSEERISRKI